MSSTLTSAYLICTVKSELKGCGCKQNRPPGYPSVAQHTIFKKMLFRSMSKFNTLRKGCIDWIDGETATSKGPDSSTAIDSGVSGNFRGGGGQTFSSTKNQ